MASRAFGRCWLVEQYVLALHRAELRVAAFAGRVLVRPLQREQRLLVVEQGGAPAARVMTLGTSRDPVAVGELGPMWVKMTRFALRRRPLEFGVHQGTFHGRGTVASRALHRAVRAGQRKFRARMVKQAKISPFLCRVARFASECPPR